MLFIDLWFICVILSICTLFFIPSAKVIFKSLGASAIPIYFVPFLPVLYVLLYPQYLIYKKNKLLDLDDTISIYSAVPKVISKLDYVTSKITNTTNIIIRYRYNNQELDNMFGYQEEEVTGNLTEIFLNNSKKLTMRESELKIMIINSRLEALKQI